MGVLYAFDYLQKAIVHDINTLERYDDEVAEGHILTVIIFKNKSEMEASVLADILKKASRKSDMVFRQENVFVLLMPATDKKGAQHIFSQMHEVCRNLDDLTILSYPEDAFGDEDFYKKIVAEVMAKNA